jgi:MFS family permease
LAEERLSYLTLFRVPGFLRLASATMLVRTAEAMWQVALVLFVLQRFHSPGLAGFSLFASIAPGIVVGPVAGVLLDRHGRIRLMLLDYGVAAAATLLIVVLAVTGRLTPLLLFPILLLASLTSPLGSVGGRSLFPVIVPRQLWDRANAVDSTGYTLTSIVGPAIAGVLTTIGGGELALAATAVLFLASTLVIVGVRDPAPSVPANGAMASAAWEAVLYVLHNPALRGLAASISIGNLGQGILMVGVPVLILQVLHGSPTLVGLAWAASGLAGVITVLIAGRFNSEGREKVLLVGGTLAGAAGFAVVALSQSIPGAILGMTLFGAGMGPGDIGLFSLRQRKTDPAWFGRAFAVSMNLNFTGVPIGSAIAGPLVALSVRLALWSALGFQLLAALAAALLVPGEGRRPKSRLK